MEQEKMKQIILDEIEETKYLIEEYKERTKPISPDNSLGRLTRMDAINNKSVVEASLRQTEDKLMNLYRALDKLGTKDFGICLECKKPIPEERLIFMPESLYCVKCAQ